MRVGNVPSLWAIFGQKFHPAAHYFFCLNSLLSSLLRIGYLLTGVYHLPAHYYLNSEFKPDAQQSPQICSLSYTSSLTLTTPSVSFKAFLRKCRAGIENSRKRAQKLRKKLRSRKCKFMGKPRGFLLNFNCKCRKKRRMNRNNQLKS